MKHWKELVFSHSYIVRKKNKDITFKFKIDVHVTKVRVAIHKKIEIECITPKLIKG